MLDLYGRGKGHFDLYEDDGTSLAYLHNAYTLTAIDYDNASGSQHLTIAPASGAFAGQVQRRSYELRLHAAGKPQSVTVDGQPVEHWSWDAASTIGHVEPAPSAACMCRYMWRGHIRRLRLEGRAPRVGGLRFSFFSR